MAHNSSNIILLKEALSTLNIDSCPSKINLHSHTTYSDGSLEPEDIIQQALDNDLEHFSVTDHHSIQSVNIISTWLNKNESYRSSLNFWPGIEISSLLNGCLVHILGIGIDVKSTLLKPYIRGDSPIGSDLKASNVIKAIKGSGGISVLAHPARYRLSYIEMIESANSLGIDAIEVWYDYEMQSLWKPSYVCKSIDNLVRSLGLMSTCGTDTHGYSILSR